MQSINNNGRHFTIITNTNEHKYNKIVEKLLDWTLMYVQQWLLLLSCCRFITGVFCVTLLWFLALFIFRTWNHKIRENLQKCHIYQKRYQVSKNVRSNYMYCTSCFKRFFAFKFNWICMWHLLWILLHFSAVMITIVPLPPVKYDFAATLPLFWFNH